MCNIFQVNNLGLTAIHILLAKLLDLAYTQNKAVELRTDQVTAKYSSDIKNPLII